MIPAIKIPETSLLYCSKEKTNFKKEFNTHVKSKKSDSEVTVTFEYFRSGRLRAVAILDSFLYCLF